MKYSKTMFLEDFEYLSYQIQHIININTLLAGIQKRFEHPHRAWEYGLALDIIRANNSKTVLDVGGGGSIFSPAVTWLGIDTLQVDPGNVGQWILDQERIIKKPLPFQQIDFFDFNSDIHYDTVVSLSVIEHVPNDREFIKRLASFVKKDGFLILTTDYHPSGIAQVDGHLRTYNEKSLMALVQELLSEFLLYDYDYAYEGSLPVNNYTFASLVLKRIL